MLAYGACKAATHFIVKSLAQPGSGLPEGTFVCGLLPVTLDTPQNRAGMPDADTSTWTPLEEVANKYAKIATGADTTVESGTLLTVETAGGKTTYQPIALGADFTL